ncbi:MAG: UDP-N-acetylenolpyruvoylglucosamine reductase [Desulfovibrionaceae bacterium CG1_02_65_16]|nr:MAG: UDP-N-acetylenolpyruvoylglucosamine reductase [Desulfovibrionaceae bacterium CG1_02_65_16]
MALQLIHEPRFAQRTTLRLGGPALVEAVARVEADLDELGALLPTLAGPTGRVLAIGAGSNLLAADGQHELVLVRADNAAAPQVECKTRDVLVRAGAGLGLPRLLGLCQRLGLSGLEGLTGVPGSVGGAVAMNAGSYGVETADALTRVRLWTPGGGLVWRAASACSFGYRHFDANFGANEGDATGLYLVWEAEFRLTQDAPDAVRGRMLAVYAKKKASQPVTAKSAGCVFKNPAGSSAGRLLDEAGMRGKRLGGMAFSDLHANFLVNLGGGTAAQALELMDFGRHAVRARFGVDLQTEVVVLK